MTEERATTMTDDGEWNRWWAWRPVKLWSGEWVWLTPVLRVKMPMLYAHPRGISTRWKWVYHN